jgi:hypothetical protein
MCFFIARDALHAEKPATRPERREMGLSCIP